MQADNPDGWRAQDFTDSPEPSLSHDDPWDPLSLLRQSPSPSNAGRSRSQSSPATTISEENERLRLGGDITESATFQTIETVENETDFLAEWFYGDSDVELDEKSPEEPVPTIEFDPELSEELYPEYDYAHTAEPIDLTYDVYIRLDAFLASVGLSNGQDSEVRERLKSFSRSRLSNWLPWFNSKSWTAQTLLLFVQFHSYWECNPEWWESRWHYKRYGWQPRRMPLSNILSRDDAYGIVHLRKGFHPEEMIDPMWFEEWDYYSLWRHGFQSFASFAKFRSALNDCEEWKSLISWGNDEEDVETNLWRDHTIDWTIGSVEGKFPTCEDTIPPYSHISSLPRWYVIQNWYPESEWHDNLGWNVPGLESPESRVQPDWSQGPIWPFGGRNE